MSGLTGEIETWKIDDRIVGKVEITGTRIAYLSTRNGPPNEPLAHPRNRWGENSVIKLGSGGYVLWRVGRSVFYHRSDTTCETAAGTPAGDLATVEDLPDDARPCRDCRPPWPQSLRDEEEIRFEFDRNTIDRCETATQVLKQLTRQRRGSGVRATTGTELTRDLLIQCEENDPDWDEGELPVQRIS